MRAHKLTGLSGVALVCLALLGGCGGGSDGGSADNNPPPPAATAEAILGASLLPPDGLITAATVLTNEDMRPSNAPPTPGLEDMPPS